jgi:hypothetical protein
MLNIGVSMLLLHACTFFSSETEKQVPQGAAPIPQAVDTAPNHRTVTTTLYHSDGQGRPMPVAEFLFNDPSQPGKDTSGHGNELTAVGTARTDFNKARGKVLFCDGKGSYLKFVPAHEGDSLSESIPTGNSPYTMSAWIYPTVWAENGIIGWGHYGETGHVTALQTRANEHILNVWWNNDLSINVGDYKEKWSHVACTFNGTSRACFWNGKVRGRDSPDPHSAKSEYFHVGHTHHGEYFNGYMDDVRVYDVAITPEHIAELATPPATIAPEPDPTPAPTAIPTSAGLIAESTPTPTLLNHPPTLKATALAPPAPTPEIATTAATTMTVTGAAAAGEDGKGLVDLERDVVTSWLGGLIFVDAANKKMAYDAYVVKIEAVAPAVGGKYTGMGTHTKGVADAAGKTSEVATNKLKFEIEKWAGGGTMTVKFQDAESTMVGVLDVKAGTFIGKVYQGLNFSDKVPAVDNGSFSLKRSEAGAGGERAVGGSGSVSAGAAVSIPLLAAIAFALIALARSQAKRGGKLIFAPPRGSQAGNEKGGSGSASASLRVEVDSPGMHHRSRSRNSSRSASKGQSSFSRPVPSSSSSRSSEEVYNRLSRTRIRGASALDHIVDVLLARVGLWRVGHVVGSSNGGGGEEYHERDLEESIPMMESAESAGDQGQGDASQWQLREKVRPLGSLAVGGMQGEHSAFTSPLHINTFNAQDSNSVDRAHR